MSATPSAQYSLTIRVEIAHRPGMLGQVAGAIGRAGGIIGAVDLVEVLGETLLRDITVDTASPEQGATIAQAIGAIGGVNDVHDLHVWSIGSNSHALSCHISIADIPSSSSDRIRREVNDCLRDNFRIYHTTIQFEHVVCEVAHGCVIPTTHSVQHEH